MPLSRYDAATSDGSSIANERYIPHQPDCIRLFGSLTGFTLFDVVDIFQPTPISIHFPKVCGDRIRPRESYKVAGTSKSASSQPVSFFRCGIYELCRILIHIITENYIECRYTLPYYMLHWIWTNHERLKYLHIVSYKSFEIKTYIYCNCFSDE